VSHDATTSTDLAALAVRTVAAWTGDEPCSIVNLLARLIERHGLSREAAHRAIEAACIAGHLHYTTVVPADGAAWFVRVAPGPRQVLQPRRRRFYGPAARSATAAPTA
jgi:hypothetical protein